MYTNTVLYYTITYYDIIDYYVIQCYIVLYYSVDYKDLSRARDEVVFYELSRKLANTAGWDMLRWMTHNTNTET